MSTFTETLTEALRLRQAMRSDGQTAEELDRGFACVLREVWPLTRVWKYLCETCRDHGLELHQCAGDATCGRVKVHAPHEYVTPCWCAAGNRYKPKERRPDDFAEAGKTAKRQPTRFGR